MAALIDRLPYAQLDWVHTAEPDAEHWHDVVDQKSVETGIQAQVGDGHPMTAWFDEIGSLADWERWYNHGGTGILVFVFTDSAVPFGERVALIQRKTGVR